MGCTLCIFCVMPQDFCAVAHIRWWNKVHCISAAYGNCSMWLPSHTVVPEPHVTKAEAPTNLLYQYSSSYPLHFFVASSTWFFFDEFYMWHPCDSPQTQSFTADKPMVRNVWSTYPAPCMQPCSWELCTHTFFGVCPTLKILEHVFQWDHVFQNIQRIVKEPVYIEAMAFLSLILTLEARSLSTSHLMPSHNADQCTKEKDMSQSWPEVSLFHNEPVEWNLTLGTWQKEDAGLARCQITMYLIIWHQIGHLYSFRMISCNIHILQYLWCTFEMVFSTHEAELLSWTLLPLYSPDVACLFHELSIFQNAHL